MEWLWWWVFEQIVALSAFFTTLVFLRLAAATTRRLWADRDTSYWGTPENVLLYLAPSIAFAAFLLWLRQSLYVIWLSATAIWLSLFFDAICLVGVAIYCFKLYSLRREPAFFASQVHLKSAFAARNFEVVGEALKHLALKIPILRRRFGNILTITSGDFRHFLKSDWRLVDSVEEIPPGMKSVEFSALPHLILAEKKNVPPPVEEAREFVDDPESFDYRKFYNFASWAANEDPVLSAIKSNSVKKTVYATNRALIAELPAELWQTSQNLCRNTPFIIALNWRQFHFQESLRLRFTTLFNTADLLQRLITSIALVKQREAGEFPEKTQSGGKQEIPRSSRECNEALWRALENSANTELDSLRRILLTPHEDFEVLAEKLEPLKCIVGHSAIHNGDSAHTLAGWRTLGILRNKLVGHGGIGWQLNLNPLLYLDALHFYFLGMMRDVAALDLSILARSSQNEISGKSQGFYNAAGSDDDLAVVAMPESDDFVALNPYWRFYNGRLLVFNRVARNVIEYIDYNVADITEPSFISLNEDAKTFTQA